MIEIITIIIICIVTFFTTIGMFNAYEFFEKRKKIKEMEILDKKLRMEAIDRINAISKFYELNRKIDEIRERMDIK